MIQCLSGRLMGQFPSFSRRGKCEQIQFHLGRMVHEVPGEPSFLVLVYPFLAVPG